MTKTGLTSLAEPTVPANSAGEEDLFQIADRKFERIILDYDPEQELANAAFLLSLAFGSFIFLLFVAIWMMRR